MSLLTRRYRQCPELGWSRFELLDQPHPAVLAHRCTWDDASLVAVHNLCSQPLIVPLQLKDCGEGARLVDLLGDGEETLDEDGATQLALGGYGYRWLRVQKPGSRRLT
jgi:hypothetical protein